MNYLLALAGDRHFAAAVTANLPEALEQLVDVPGTLLKQHGIVSPRWPQRWLAGYDVVITLIWD